MSDTGLAYLHPEDPDLYFKDYARVYEITGTHGEAGTTPAFLRFFVRAAIFPDTFFTRDLYFDMRWPGGLFLMAVGVLILMDAAVLIDCRNLMARSYLILTDPAAYAAMAHASNLYGDGKASVRIADVLARE